jgi:hypothetical protein
MVQISSSLRRCCLAAGAVACLVQPVSALAVHAADTLTGSGTSVVADTHLPPGGGGFGGRGSSGMNPDEQGRSGNNTLPRGTHIFPGLMSGPGNGAPASNLPSTSIPGGTVNQPEPTMSSESVTNSTSVEASA